MVTAALVSPQEYLATTYRPDVDYIDGRLEERNMGERSHGRIQNLISAWLLSREKLWGTVTLVEVRLRTGATRFRVPDVMVLSADAPDEAVVATPPLLCIEILSPILSPSDTLQKMWDRTQDYLAMGVPVCWIVDPSNLRAWTVTSAGLTEVKDGILRAGAIEMPLSEIAG